MTAACVEQNVILRERLTRPFRPGHAERMQGVVFETQVDVSGETLCSCIFEGCRFLEGLRAVGAEFRGIAWFRDCTFDGDVDLTDARCSADLRLDRSRFAAPVDFSGIEVHGVLDLDNTLFEAAADLARMTVLGSFSFARAQCRAAVNLEDTQCYGGAWFDHTVFAADSNLSGMEVYGRTWLVGARLGPEAAAQIRSHGLRWSDGA